MKITDLILEYNVAYIDFECDCGAKGDVEIYGHTNYFSCPGCKRRFMLALQVVDGGE